MVRHSIRLQSRRKKEGIIEPKLNSLGEELNFMHVHRIHSAGDENTDAITGSRAVQFRATSCIVVNLLTRVETTSVSRIVETWKRTLKAIFNSFRSFIKSNHWSENNTKNECWLWSQENSLISFYTISFCVSIFKKLELYFFRDLFDIRVPVLCVKESFTCLCVSMVTYYFYCRRALLTVEWQRTFL